MSQIDAHLFLQSFVFAVFVVEAVVIGEAFVVGIEHAHRRRDDFLCSNASDEAYVELPVEALWSEDWFHSFTDAGDVALFLLLLIVKMLRMGEVAQCPNNDRGYKNNATHLLEILFAFFPSMSS